MKNININENIKNNINKIILDNVDVAKNDS